jgi:hypothetical protein
VTIDEKIVFDVRLSRTFLELRICPSWLSTLGAGHVCP